MSEFLRRVSAQFPADQVRTSAGEGLPRARRYSSKLALVLSGGGARAAYQVGVLAALAERLPELEFPILTGVSAGAINTIYLAAHPGPLAAAVDGLRAEWHALTAERVFRGRSGSLLRSAAGWALSTLLGRRTRPTLVRGILDTQPLREFLGATIDVRGIEANIMAGRLRAAALSATSITSGWSVSFVQGTSDAPTWERASRKGVRGPLTLEHVMASAAIPILFPAVPLAGEFYCDGGVGQGAPLAPAIHLGARAVFVIGMKTRWKGQEPVAVATQYPSAAEVAGLLLGTIFQDQLEADADRLARINRLLAALPSTTPPPDGLKPVDLLLLRPRRDLASLARGHTAALSRSVRSIVKGMGGQREGAADFLSYVAFESAYTAQLMELGYEDTGAQWSQIEPFFAKLERRPDESG
ncbi:MAG: patatin-like phospholipase family protein [Gemmatimonadales bacterium]